MRNSEYLKMFYNFPFKLDGRGHTAQVDMDTHILQMVEQLLFTEIGERVNRPSFGTPINQLVFAPNSEELAIATGQLIQGALQQWLGDLIQVSSVNVESKEMELHVTIQYINRRNQLIQRVEFNRGLKIGTSN